MMEWKEHRIGSPLAGYDRARWILLLPRRALAAWKKAVPYLAHAVCYDYLSDPLNGQPIDGPTQDPPLMVLLTEEQSWWHLILLSAETESRLLDQSCREKGDPTRS
jgi:hypothetical protein